MNGEAYPAANEPDGSMAEAAKSAFGAEALLAEADQLSPFRRRVLDSARCIFWQICRKNEETGGDSSLLLEPQQLARCIGVSSTMITDALSSLQDTDFLAPRRTATPQSIIRGRQALFGPTEKLQALGFAIGPRCATEQVFQPASEVTPLQSYVGFCLLCKEGTIAKIQKCIGGVPASIRSVVQRLSSQELVEVEETFNGRSFIYRLNAKGRHFFDLLPEAHEWREGTHCRRQKWLPSVRPSPNGSEEQTANPGKKETVTPAKLPSVCPTELAPQLRRAAGLISPDVTEDTLAHACPDLLGFTAQQLEGLVDHLQTILVGDVESQEVRDPSIRDLIIWMKAQK